MKQECSTITGTIISLTENRAIVEIDAGCSGCTGCRAFASKQRINALTEKNSGLLPGSKVFLNKNPGNPLFSALLIFGAPLFFFITAAALYIKFIPGKNEPAALLTGLFAMFTWFILLFFIEKKLFKNRAPVYSVTTGR